MIVKDFGWQEAFTWVWLAWFNLLACVFSVNFNWISLTLFVFGGTTVLRSVRATLPIRSPEKRWWPGDTTTIYETVR